MIYCGYQGVGKTSYCKTHPNCVDLDSSNFEKVANWEVKYVNSAIDIESKGNNVFISAHREVIEYLTKINHKFILVIPSDNKKIWGLRLTLRYEITKQTYALKALNDFKRNFSSDMKYYKSLQCKKVFVSAVRVLTNLEEQFQEGVTTR